MVSLEFSVCDAIITCANVIEFCLFLLLHS